MLRGQLPSGRTLARLAEGAASLLSRSPGYESGGLHQALVDEPDEDLPMPATDSVIRRVLTSPGVLLCAGLILVALVAERSLAGSVLTGSGTLKGGMLVPAWGGASDLWREYLAGYHETGVGSAASAPPYLGLMAALATGLAGKSWLATDVLLLGCVPAAGIAAFLAARRITPVLVARCWIAVTYALLPVAMGAVATGRIGTAVVFVLLPLIGITIERMLTGPPRAARRAAWATGLLVAVAAAFVPLVWPIAVVAALGVAVAWPWLGRRAAVNAAIVAAVPAVALIPWTFHLLTQPSAFLLEAGVPRPGLASAGLRPESVLLLSPGGPGLPPAWVTVGLVLPAFCALLARRRITLVYTGWGIALSGLAIALAVSRVRVTPPQGGTAVSTWPGIAIAIAAVGLLLAATPLIEAVARSARADGPPAARHYGEQRSWIAGGSRGVGPPGLALLAVAVSVPVLAAGYWLVEGVRGPVTAAGPQILPPFVAAASSGPDRSRTLVVRQDGGVLTYTVLRNTDPVLGEPELVADSSATQALGGVVGSLDAAASGDAGDTGQALSQFDIGYVLLPAPIDQALAHQLNGAPGLIPLTVAPAYDLWQVAGAAARVRVIGSDGTVVPVPSGPIGVQAEVAPGTGGTLVLAEPVGGWSATLNGRPLVKLAAAVDGWAQGWVLPAGGGRLVIGRNETARDASLAVEAVAVLVVFALALPGTRSAVPAPAPAVEAETRPEPEAIPAEGRRRNRAGPGPVRRTRTSPQYALAGSRAPGADPSGSPEFGADPAEIGAANGDSSAASAGYGPEPVMSAEPGADDGVSPRAMTGTAATGAPPGAPRRPRGGQHAARHGKPSRRWRSRPAARPGTGPAEVVQPPAMTAQGAGGTSLDQTQDNLGPHPGDESGGPPGSPPPDPAATDPRPPWDLGDQP